MQAAKSSLPPLPPPNLDKRFWICTKAVMTCMANHHRTSLLHVFLFNNGYHQSIPRIFSVATCLHGSLTSRGLDPSSSKRKTICCWEGKWLPQNYLERLHLKRSKWVNVANSDECRAAFNRNLCCSSVPFLYVSFEVAHAAVELQGFWESNHRTVRRERCWYGT